jgi:LysM repeat protein
LGKTGFGRSICAVVATATLATLLWCGNASAALPHVVQTGETLWSISAANNLTTRTVAVYNGLPEDALLIEGTTINVPTVDEGAAALASGTAPYSPPAIAGGGDAATGSAGSSASTGTDVLNTIAPAAGMAHIPSPYGELHLAPAAAEAWNAMRAESLQVYGVDLYPSGPVSAYRTYEQQAALYQRFIDGVGAPANPPGTSSHELGTAVDVETQQMRWVIDQIGWKYGWAKVHGPAEWWHVDYVGVGG